MNANQFSDRVEPAKNPPKPLKQLPQASGRAIGSLVCGLLSCVFTCVTGVPAILLGLAALSDIRRDPQRIRGKGLAICGVLTGSLGTLLLIAILGCLFWVGHRAAVTSQNLKKIGLALHNYHDMHRAFPPRGVEIPQRRSNDPKPRMMLSWRVRLLPYLEQQVLYDQFDLNQPWDSPHNKQLISKMPEIYQSPARRSNDAKTVYLGVVYPEKLDGVADQKLLPFLRGCFFDELQGRDYRRPGFHCSRFMDFRDGIANTLAVVEADPNQAVIWTKPDDWEFDVHNPRQGLGGIHWGGFLALFADGSVQMIPTESDDQLLRCLFGRADGQVVELPSLQSR